MSIEIHEMPISSGWQIYQSSWKLIKPHFLTALVFTLAYFLGQLLLTIIPFVGTPLSGFGATIMTAGMFHAANKIFQGQSIEIEDLLVGIQNRQIFEKIWPLAVISGLANYIPESLATTLSSFGSNVVFFANILGFLVVLAISAIVYFAVAIQIFDEAELFESLELSLRATTKNWAVFIVSGIFMMGAFCASALTLFLGLIVLLPVVFFAGYFCYLGMFRNFQFENYLKPGVSEVDAKRSSIV